MFIVVRYKTRIYEDNIFKNFKNYLLVKKIIEKIKRIKNVLEAFKMRPKENLGYELFIFSCKFTWTLNER